MFQEKSIKWYISIIVPPVYKLLFSSPIILEEQNFDEIQIDYLNYIYFIRINL